MFIEQLFKKQKFKKIFQLTQGDGSTVHTVQSLEAAQENMTVDLTEATLGQDGQIIITGEDGQGKIES